MLAELLIRDIVLIDKLVLRFPAGLSVLTGETGAGKSILLDAFALALGARGDGGLVRHGEKQGQVTAVFDLTADHPAREIAQAADLEIDGDLILRRVQLSDGRTRAFVNDQPVGVGALKAIGRSLVEIHGQHDDRALLDPASHRGILDAFGGLTTLAGEVAAAAATVRAARTELLDEEAGLAASRKDQDYLAHALDELTALAPEAGEEEALTERRQLLMNAEKIAADLGDVLEAVAGSGAPSPALAAGLRRLERRAAGTGDLLATVVTAVDGVLVALDGARAALEDALRACEFSPSELERAEERLFKLKAAARKYNVTPDDLAKVRDRFATDLDAIETGEGRVAAARAAVAAAERDYLHLAERLSAGRVSAAAALDSAVALELPPLRLDRARFMARVETDRDGRDPGGFDRVEFWAQTNPGTRPGPMMKVASGGELSRFILAVKVVLADRGSAPTLVFDEIDTGVGGAVAGAIGQRLLRLSARVQVMAITHAPQVAARASSHFLIVKDAVPGTDRVATRVAALDDTPRREEIARMLAGASVTDEARAAALKLIEAALH